MPQTAPNSKKTFTAFNSYLNMNLTLHLLVKMSGKLAVGYQGGVFKSRMVGHTFIRDMEVTLSHAFHVTSPTSQSEAECTPQLHLLQQSLCITGRSHFTEDTR